MYKKMFVLFVKSTNEYVVTYNVEQGNVNSIPANTILVHHKKESNTLYTINALNDLIKKLNNPRLKAFFNEAVKARIQEIELEIKDLEKALQISKAKLIKYQEELKQ